MAKITGLGGLFFRAQDPDKLSKWYQENLGVVSDANGMPWQQEAGMTILSTFSKDNDYFPSAQAVMFNFRVDDLDTFLEELKSKNVKIDDKRQNESYGKFAWIYDLEGNKIELWQPIT